MTYWMMDYALRKSVKILPKDERRIELPGGIIVDLDDSLLNSNFGEIIKYEYLKNGNRISSTTNETRQYFTTENCPENKTFCEKIEEREINTPPRVYITEIGGNIIGTVSDVIYKILKISHLDALL